MRRLRRRGGGGRGERKGGGGRRRRKEEEEKARCGTGKRKRQCTLINGWVIMTAIKTMSTS